MLPIKIKPFVRNLKPFFWFNASFNLIGNDINITLSNNFLKTLHTEKKGW